MVNELALGLEWAANAKAAMLPVANVLEKAIRDGELEIPEHRQSDLGKSSRSPKARHGLIFRFIKRESPHSRRTDPREHLTPRSAR
jgi:hypothetical protein